MKKAKLKTTNPGRNPKGRNYVANYEHQRVCATRLMLAQALELTREAQDRLHRGDISDYDHLMCEVFNRTESVLFALNIEC